MPGNLSNGPLAAQGRRVQLGSAEGAEPSPQLEAETGAAGLDLLDLKGHSGWSPSRKPSVSPSRVADPPDDLRQIPAVARPPFRRTCPSGRAPARSTGARPDDCPVRHESAPRTLGQTPATGHARRSAQLSTSPRTPWAENGDLRPAVHARPRWFPTVAAVPPTPARRPRVPYGSRPTQPIPGTA